MKKALSLPCWCLGGFLLVFGSLAAWADPIRISGTGAGISAMKQVTETYRQQHPDSQVQFLTPPMGSSGAIKAVTNRQLDVALTGRPLKKEEESANLVQEWLGRSPFLFVVHQNAPVTHITLAQVIDMYAGRQKTWPDGSRVRVVLRPETDADTGLLKSISPAMAGAVTTAHAQRAPGSALADTDVDLVDTVEKIPGGLGAVALSIILAEHRPLKGLILDGREPTVAALESNRYPYFKPLYLVTRRDASPSLRALAGFLRSEEGEARLLQLGISTTQR
ncbi:MAG: substrate-binding domain-containing protein [Magnetococcus sp. DMHC-1]|nr:substrate-binding domain-containing protein [Magnetococcales bacterium]